MFNETITAIVQGSPHVLIPIASGVNNVNAEGGGTPAPITSPVQYMIQNLGPAMVYLATADAGATLADFTTGPNYGLFLKVGEKINLRLDGDLWGVGDPAAPTLAGGTIPGVFNPGAKALLVAVRMAL